MNYAPLAILLVLLAIDWRQTVTICRTPGRREVWIEKIIGVYPKEHRVHLWFGACAGAAVLAYVFLPWWVLLPFIAVETGAVMNNYRVGIKPAGL